MNQMMEQPSAEAPMDGQQPIAQDKYLELLQLFENVKQAAGKLNSTQFMTKNHAAQSKRDALRMVFDEMAAAGVDLNDPQSVSGFLQKMEQKNPDLYQLFEEAVNGLLNDNETNNEAQNGSITEGLQGVPERI